MKTLGHLQNAPVFPIMQTLLPWPLGHTEYNALSEKKEKAKVVVGKLDEQAGHREEAQVTLPSEVYVIYTAGSSQE